MIRLAPWKRYEYKLRKTVYNWLKQQFSYIKRHREKLYAKPNSWIWLQYKEAEDLTVHEFRQASGMYWMISAMHPDVEKILISWYRARRASMKKQFAELDLEFSVKNEAIDEYMNNWTKINLSDFKGSISRTTKSDVISIFQEAYAKQTSIADIQKEINALEPNLFDMARAKRIAVTEMWNAFEAGNAIPIKEAINMWQKAEKMRSTVWDMKVDDICAMNEQDGWIPFDQAHSSGDDMPLAHCNCRCTELYRFV